MKALLHFFKESDPGYFRLIHAAKTILAIIITLYLTQGPNKEGMLFAALAAGFSMQGIKDQSRTDQMITALILYVFMFIGYSAGSFAKPYPVMVMLLLAVTGFFSFYVHRFGPRFIMFPMFAWIFCFLSTILPSGSHVLIVSNMRHIVIGFCVSYLVFFYVLPKRNNVLFYKHFRSFIGACKHHLAWLQSSFEKPIAANKYKEQMQSNLQSLRKLILENQPIVDSAIVSKTPLSMDMKALFLKQYTIGKAIVMLLSTRLEMLENNIEISNETHRFIINMINTYKNYLNNIQINHHKFFVRFTKPSASPLDALDTFRELIENCFANKKNSSIYLINIDFSFRYLWDELEQLGPRHV